MTELIHQTATVEGLKWHWVEAGDGDAVVLLHGVPESWHCWKRQIPILARQFRVIAPDLKGYGLSDKRDGDYTGPALAKELLQLLDHLGVDRFRLAGHDWGVFVGDNIINEAPERVEQYVRCCLSLHAYDARNALHHQWISRNPAAASRLMQKAEGYVRVWFESACKPGCIPGEEEIAELVNEFSWPGIAEAVPRYFRDLAKAKKVDYSKFAMPVLYVHGEHDPRQPVEYCRGMEDHLPGLEAILVLDCGHFVTREKPQELANAMLWFFNRMLAPGVPLFERSRAYGLPTRPVKPMDAWGLNSFQTSNES